MVRWVPGGVRPVVALASFSTYAVVGYAVLLVGALVLLLRRRRRGTVVVAVLAATGLVIHAVTLAPLLTGPSDRAVAAAPGRGSVGDLTVMTSNLEYGRGDADSVVRTATDRRVDVLVLEEVTPAGLRRLDRAGVRDRLPHLAGRAQPGAAGTVVLSRWPVRTVRSLGLRQGSYEVAVGGPRPFALLAVHTAMPLIDAPRWAADLGRLRQAVQDTPGPVVVAGDLNATRDHEPFRRVLASGVREAGEEAGSGWQPTWPSPWVRSWLRPVIGLDHVLVGGGLHGVRTAVVPVPDTDHEALVADLAWSRPAPSRES